MKIKREQTRHEYACVSQLDGSADVSTQQYYRWGSKHATSTCKFKTEKCHRCSKMGHIVRAEAETKTNLWEPSMWNKKMRLMTVKMSFLVSQSTKLQMGIVALLWHSNEHWREPSANAVRHWCCCDTCVSIKYTNRPSHIYHCSNAIWFKQLLLEMSFLWRAKWM